MMKAGENKHCGKEIMMLYVCKNNAIVKVAKINDYEFSSISYDEK